MALLIERPRPARIRQSRRGWWLAIAAVCLGAFMGQLDASIAVLTYPALEERFHAPAAAVEWVSLGYLLTLIALLVPAGRLADAHGRKLFYLYGFLVFTLASAACGLAPTLSALIGFRLVQAIGAAALQANSVALVATSAPRGRLRAALGVQAGAQAVGLALGPTLGAVIVTGLGWRWVFLLNVPVGVVALIAGNFFLPRTRNRTAVDRFDWPGFALLAVSSTALLLAISAASGLELSGVEAAALFVIAVTASLAFARRLSHAASPLVNPVLLRTRGTALGLAGALGGYLVLFGPLVLVPAVLTARGDSLALAGLVLTALPAGFAVTALAADRILPRGWTDRRRALAGAALALGALLAVLAMFALSVAGSDFAAVLAVLLALLGLGLGVFAPANNALIMAAIPRGTEATGGGLVNMARALGTALGVALVTLSLHQGSHSGGAAAALLALIATAVLIVTAASDARSQMASQGA